jgi:hypothetical protein
LLRFTQGGGSACATVRRALPWAGMVLSLWGGSSPPMKTFPWPRCQACMVPPLWGRTVPLSARVKLGWGQCRDAPARIVPVR